MGSSEGRVLWFVVALLVSVIAGLVVGYLSNEGSPRKAVLCGLAAFGATLVASITIESQLGVV